MDPPFTGAVIVALPALLISSNSTFEAQKLVIVASAAVLLPRKNTKPPVKPIGSLPALLPARPAVIFAVPAVLPSLKFTELVPSTWMDAASALLLSKKFKTLSPPTVKVAVPALLVSKKFVIPEGRLVVIVALPALLLSKKLIRPLLVIVASPAVAVPPPKKGRRETQFPGTVHHRDGRMISRTRILEKNGPATRGSGDYRTTCFARILKFDVRSPKTCDRRISSRAAAPEEYETAGEAIGICDGRY